MKKPVLDLDGRPADLVDDAVFIADSPQGPVDARVLIVSVAAQIVVSGLFPDVLRDRVLKLEAQSGGLELVGWVGGSSTSTRLSSPSV